MDVRGDFVLLLFDVDGPVHLQPLAVNDVDVLKIPLQNTTS